MKKPRIQHEVQHSYRRFGWAVAFYVIGVLAFSTLSYITHGRAAKSALNQVAVIESLESVFMLAMAFVLIILYHRARAKSMHQVEDLNRKLKTDFQKLKEHESELEDAIHDLERFNALATGREQRILELKDEVNQLLQETNRPMRYQSASTD